MATYTDTINQIRSMFGKFSPVQKISLAALTAAVIIAFILILSWASKPKYEVLFSNLAPKDAGRIVEELKTAKVPYKYESGGTVIMVPQKDVYDLRMKFANMGIPMEGVVGYEIFDQTKLGMTDFVQKLNYNRALEGELSRTLTSMNEILQARVHIVVPKPALFEEDKKPATASVALRIKGDRQLSREQILGISNLIASSVEGLAPENITIVDSRGNILSSEVTRDKAVALSASQHELQRQVEKYLEDKAQSLLISALGSNRSIVRVTAELNFNKIEKTAQTFDPASQVVRSEEVVTKSGTDNSQSQSPQPGATSSSTAQNEEESTVTNYEISNTVEHVVNSMGNILHLSVAVLVDGTYRITEVEKGKEKREYVERSKEELAKLETIVKNAIGYDNHRGDQISVSSFPFDTSEEEAMTEEFASAARYEFWRDLIQKATMVVIIVAMFFTLRVLIRRSKRLTEMVIPLAAAPPHVPSAVYAPPIPEIGVEDEAARIRAKIREEMSRKELEITADTLEKEEMVKRINKFVEQKPAEASQLIKTWIYEEAV